MRHSWRSKYQRSYAYSAQYRTYSSVYINKPRIEASKMQAIKSRTWHRSNNDSTVPVVDNRSVSNPASLHTNILKGGKPQSTLAPLHTNILKGGKPQSTLYIRKRNSLVRKSSSVATVSKGLQGSNRYKAGGRIFRIGSFRYRMDPSRKTLQRIVDGGSRLDALKVEDSKRVYVPKRLLIGKDEYLRTGNGNQLIRDPKKRIRMLANEKIKWSLHNVRSRSIKKRRFCQFYTRFGKCIKDDGKCPFIHDSSKIAVCTKFLKGMCTGNNCKLTHKIIPERMEDCSYFLQGMCSNEKCPYRHVNVNPNAATCKGFLKGYCADGDECQKKHSYVCNVFEETGSCPQGSKCRLHHPKKQKAIQGSSKILNSTIGRYFGSPSLEVPDLQNDVFIKQATTSSANIFRDGDIPEFISLDIIGDDDDNITKDTSCASKNVDNATDTEVCNLDTLIKPVRILNKKIGNINLPNQV